MKDKILIVDDEADLLHVLRSHFTFDNYEVFTAESGEAALAFLGQSTVDAVLCDMAMPGLSGVELLREIRMMDAFLPVIIMTGVGTIESAVEAIKLGAFHYVTKPFDTQDLKLLVKRAIENGRLHRRLVDKELEDRVQGQLVVGSSRGVLDIMHTVDKVAGSDVSILILGETGTGKSALARLIHEKSQRKNQPFLIIDCASLADNLLESELFGHVKGAFTGAVSAKRGLLEEAQGGTVFLDEIGEMPPSTQVKLLHAVQELEVKPVGGNRSVKIDVRIISATSRDLQHEIKAGNFREELFFRLAVISLRLPPLRDRKNDLLLFVDHFVAKFNRKYKKNVHRIDPLVVTLLLAAPWRGNIRELENTIERAVLLAEAETLTAENLCLVGPGSEVESSQRPSLSLKTVVEEAEKVVINQTLADTGGNRSEAAKRLGIGRRTLYDKISAYGLE